MKRRPRNARLKPRRTNARSPNDGRIDGEFAGRIAGKTLAVLGMIAMIALPVPVYPADFMTRTVPSLLVDLQRHWQELADLPIDRLFELDPDRFSTFSLTFDDLLVDVSKTALTREVFDLLIELAVATGVEDKRAAMFSGERINNTEKRAALHVALRNRSNRPISVDGADVMPDVNGVLDRLGDYAEKVRAGVIRGASGRPFTDVVNIGIGGSDLGPAMVARALTPDRGGGPNVHFVSNVDGAHIADTLAGLDPETTLFLIASKTFTTLETMTNAATARDWIMAKLNDRAVRAHFAAVSTNIEKATEFGIAEQNIFGFWDWVGGRYSLWSAIGLPVAMAVGKDNFETLLAGAHEMDEHFRTAPLTENIPVVMALLGVWHRDICGYGDLAVVPYDQRLELFVAHLQQLDMESNGKRVRADGATVAMPTGPAVWGAAGTNGQHAFFQLLHQGTDVIPVDFLIAAEPREQIGDHHEKLIANCLAQSAALMRGRDEAEVRKRLSAAGTAPKIVDKLAPHKVFPGSRPTTTLMYRRLDPRTLGRLIALYEHKVFVQGAVWGINSFDQWGVELGKELAASLLDVVADGTPADAYDGSTRGLVDHLRTLRDW